MEILKSDLERCKTAIQKLFFKRKGYELNDEQFRFVSLIDDAKHDIENYLKHPEMMPGYMLKKQLEMIIRELDSMAEDKGQGSFHPYYPRGITDSWDYNDNLGKKLMQISDLYWKLRIKARQNKS